MSVFVMTHVRSFALIAQVAQASIKGIEFHRHGDVFVVNCADRTLRVYKYFFMLLSFLTFFFCCFLMVTLKQDIRGAAAGATIQWSSESGTRPVNCALLCRWFLAVFFTYECCHWYVSSAACSGSFRSNGECAVFPTILIMLLEVCTSTTCFFYLCVYGCCCIVIVVVIVVFLFEGVIILSLSTNAASYLCSLRQRSWSPYLHLGTTDG